MGDWNAIIVGEGRGDLVVKYFDLRKRESWTRRLPEKVLPRIRNCITHVGDTYGEYQIDYIIVKGRYKNQVKGFRSYFSLDR